MLSAKDIRNVKFSKSMGGYKQEEVDILLDKIEVDYENYDRTVRELNEKVEKLKAELEQQKSAESSIQNVLVSAQRLADQIVAEAKVKSEQIVKNAETSIELITAREKELTDAFDRKASERKAMVEKEIAAMIADAEKKHAAIEKATADSVARQQVLFDKLKLEISAFKEDVMLKYKEHIELLRALPDEVPNDPKAITEMVKNAIDKAPEPEAFIEPEKPVEVVAESEPSAKEDKIDEIVRIFAENNLPKEEVSSGFVIDSELLSADKEEEEL